MRGTTPRQHATITREIAVVFDRRANSWMVAHPEVIFTSRWVTPSMKSRTLPCWTMLASLPAGRVDVGSLNGTGEALHSL